MAVMPKEVQELFEQVPTVVFATASLEGQPNAAAVGMKKVIDDSTLYVSDQFFKKTLANVQANAKVSIAFWSDKAAYQLHGTARYVNEGDEFAAQKEWVDAKFASMGVPITSKGGCFVTVDAVYVMQAGPQAGERISKRCSGCKEPTCGQRGHRYVHSLHDVRCLLARCRASSH